ncbi:sensor histidine kinase [Marinitoga lauensis]|uniref:sensor histidine kinase n=1 Tax=Marinitoga lauensis TaxID=2201189 RepID=UPI001011AC9F|nr:HAMP domain-containing protein [Marinitoga lauensis]
MIITNIIIILTSLVLSFYFRIDQIMKYESEKLVLLTKNFENKLNDVFSEVNNYILEISSSNDVIFIFDKNSLISNFSKKALKREFDTKIKGKSYIDGIYITDENNNKFLYSGKSYSFPISDGIDFQILNNNFYIIFNKRIDSKKERYLTFLVNLNKIYEEYTKSLRFNTTYKLLASFNNELVLIENENLIQKINDDYLKNFFISNDYNNHIDFEGLRLQILKSYDVIFSTIRRIILIYFIAIIVAVVISWLISKYLAAQTTTSINEITKIIENSKSGHFELIQIKDSYEEEIKTLSQKFNDMVKELNKYIHDMEKIVAARTEKINEQNKELEKLNNKLKEISITDGLTDCIIEDILMRNF